MQLQATARDRVVALTTMCFDIAGLEIWLPLVAGGAVLIASREEAMDPELLSDFVKTQEPTIMQATPTTWRMLLRFGWAGRKGLKALCGGEALPIELKEDLMKRVGALWCGALALCGAWRALSCFESARARPGCANCGMGG